MRSASNEHETAAVVALLRRGQRRWHHYADIIEDAGSALGVLAGDVPVCDPSDPLTLFPDESEAPAVELDPVVDEVRSWGEEGMRILTILDDAYPQNLRSIHNRPPILFVRGGLLPGDQRSIAVVGTRRPTDYGLRDAEVFASRFAEAGFTVVSGLARGIDTAVHEATRAAGGRTIAVIGTGLRRAYPKENAALQDLLGREAAVISQFWPDAPPTKVSFPMRNVVMSGVSLATVVIEAGETSGARTQARFALEHGRPVFLCARVLETAWAREYRTRPGVHVVETAEEVLARVDRPFVSDALTV